MKYFLDNRLLSDKQHGFVKGRSTVTQLLTILDDWTSKLEEGGQIDAVYTDLEKAFDKVPHRYLLYKLRKYNLDDDLLNWVSAFLIGRRQRVGINGVYSKWSEVISGIPQGSVLGPALFIIYINDLVHVCSGDSGIFLYADDAKLYRHVLTDYDRIMLQQDIDNIVRWMNKFLLNLNVKKCKVVTYGKHSTVSNEYKIGGHVLECLDTYRDLGVTFDKKLKFSVHITDKVKRANNMLAIIKRNFKHLPRDPIIGLYKSLVRTHLEYAEQVWSPYLKGDIERLERVQMRATKMIPGLRNRTYEERLRILELPTLKYRRTRGDMIALFKLVACNNVSGCFDNSIVKFILSSVTNTRGHRYKLCIPYAKSNLRHHFFGVRAVSIWNGLSDDVVSAPSVDSFKNRLDKFWSSQEVLYNYECDFTGAGTKC